MRKMKLATIAILAAMALALAPVAAFAASNVDFQGEAEKFVFAPGSDTSPTDLFPAFKDIVPGDTLTDTVDVKNSSSDTVKIYLRALGAEENSSGLLSQVTLTVAAKNANLFEATADQTAGLTDWVLLGTMEPGGSATLDVSIAAPLSMGNEYQDTIGTLTWEFKAEQVEDPAPDPDPKKSSSKTPAAKAGTAKTPDTNPVLPFAVLAAISTFALGLAVATRTRKQ